MPNYVPDSINSTVESATIKTQKMVDDFKKTDTGKKVSQSTNAALGSVYSLLDSLLSKGEELVDRYLPSSEAHSSAEEQSETSAATTRNSDTVEGASPLSRAMALGSTVCSRLYDRGASEVTAFGNSMSMSWQKVYASVMGYFTSYLDSFKSMLLYLRDTFPAVQIAEEDLLATSMKKSQDAVHQYTAQAKETAAKYSAQAKDAANKYSTDVKEKATKAKETASMYAADAKDTASKYAADAKETAGKYATDAKDTASKYAAGAKDTAGRYAADAKATADKYYQSAADKVSTYSK
ncbi:hypothetical protein FOZ60_006432 [Perkinsus olseni]|uniref:Uncharacterized protein n=1 Tax=Perkinsus olseni TaxID=32597 RepID=A0A7J6PHQ8_PEROL|nr:hypothetical protein FOZ60_006432 [Perkinsus olseni]